ncbi:uncharacterized protein BDZ99DRAFT_475820 [Mytilinidion resinicola]|uniref:Uncharacterized protein n=1 Tax=Mytilinidion resinicola TaxID=574789 RepID=A0A6A6YSR1_9PEZI|nr:uncharacterized protein BDZ99DRAFT_475820 [Mytilinidion resinicola]KAF2810957.1 hypothetical protein BDZ99DRAFT_475820 [Mytilinidion resinicola]
MSAKIKPRLAWDEELFALLKNDAYVRGGSPYGDSLQQLTSRRSIHREAVERWLSDHLADGQRIPDDSEFLWIYDVIDTNRTGRDDLDYIAELLIENEYDSPWIVREEHLNSNSKLKEPDPRRHAPDCVHQLSGNRTIEPEANDWHHDQPKPNSTTVTAPLGIAGFRPYEFKKDIPAFGKETSELWHQAQISECRSHIRVREQSIEVFYVPHDTSVSEHLENEGRLQDLTERISKSIESALSAISWLQENRRCCDRLTFLRPLQGSPEIEATPLVIESSYIPIELVLKLSRAFQSFRETIISQGSIFSFIHRALEYAPGVTMAATALGPATALGVGTFFAAAAGINHRRSRISKGIELDVLVHAVLSRLGPGFRSLPAGIEPENQSERHTFPLIQRSASSVQFLCTVIQSYFQAHIGELNYPWLVSPVSSVKLGGINIPSGPHITASLHELTCLGKMLGERVMVFHYGQSDWQPSGECDLFTSPEELVDMWGPASLFRLVRSIPSAGGIKSIYIRGGFILPVPGRVGAWHWSPGSDFEKVLDDQEMLERGRKAQHKEEGLQVPRIRNDAVLDTKALEEELSAFQLDLSSDDNMVTGSDLHPRGYLDISPGCGPNTRILNGATLQVNKACPLSTPDAQKNLRCRLQDSLRTIGTYDPIWTLKALQVGVQGGQYIIPQVTGTFEYMPGKTRKEVLLDTVTCMTSEIASQLRESWGLHISLCTGAAVRVKLQEVLADCIVPYWCGRIVLASLTHCGKVASRDGSKD